MAFLGPGLCWTVVRTVFEETLPAITGLCNLSLAKVQHGRCLHQDIDHPALRYVSMLKASSARRIYLGTSLARR